MRPGRRPAPPEITKRDVRRLAALSEEIADSLDEALTARIAQHLRDPHIKAAIVGGVATAISRLERAGLIQIGDDIARVVRVNRPPRKIAH